MIGLTDKKPTTAGPTLTGWDASVVDWTQYLGQSATGGTPDAATVGMTTSILPNSEILFGESTHSWAGMDEDGFEFAESWSPRSPRVRMGIDSRIPSVTNPGGGRCSLATFEVAVPTAISPATTFQINQQNPETGATDASEGYYLKVEGVFDSSITDWVGGQVVYRDPSDVTNNVETPVTFELTSNPSGTIVNRRSPISYTDTSGVVFSYIKISNDIGTSDPNNITLIGRPVTLTAKALGQIKSKLFKFDPFPLYLVGKLMDNSKINNISVKETIGETQTTTSPILAVTNGSVGVIDNASGNAESGTPPTNFTSVKRLSSSEVDIQNEQKLRPSITKDIFYIGANSTEEIDMSKVFGVDRNVITPDNLNLEATFFTAKKLDGSSGDTGNVQLTLNYKEQ
tara:strand:- start:318 stop:1514 length:1197 start_codon:yes stop_codon:yes gene_type:complete